MLKFHDWNAQLKKVFTRPKEFLILLHHLHIDSAISCKKAVILEDFNEDLLHSDTRIIEFFFEHHSFKQEITQAMTNQVSLLDLIYYNIVPAVFKTEVCYTFHSDHEASFVAMIKIVCISVFMPNK